MNIHIAQLIARKLRRQRAFAKLTKRSAGSKTDKVGDTPTDAPDDNGVKD